MTGFAKRRGDERERTGIDRPVLAVAAGIGAAVAYQSDPAPLVASFDYAYLVFAGLWGYLLFAETPDALTVTGMAMILIGGVTAVTRRET